MAEELSKNHEIIKLDIKNLFKFKFRDIKKFNPEIVHFIVGPNTILSFAVAKAFSLFNNTRVVMSALQPSPFWFRVLVHLMKPDLMLVQSYKYEKMFGDLGCETKFLPNGVDINRFAPVSEKCKEELRAKYKIEQDKFVILHVGPIKKRRNIEVFKELQKKGNQVIIIGRESQEREMNLYQTLKRKGCKIWTNYLKDIEEVYALSDCYVFPTSDEYSCIEMPLSVLEAMACNLPVISTKFRALPRVFDEGGGLFFIERDDDIYKTLEKIRNGIEIKTREKVLPYSLENIVIRLEKIYEETTKYK
jgi:glycosyltransferase involved in cell wall biosynthesis